MQVQNDVFEGAQQAKFKYRSYTNFRNTRVEALATIKMILQWTLKDAEQFGSSYRSPQETDEPKETAKSSFPK